MTSLPGSGVGSSDHTRRTDTATLVVVDDHILFAQGLQLVLEEATAGALKVVATSGDAGAAEELVRRHHPDLAIVDLAMPPPGGFAAIRAIKKRYPRVRVLALSGVDSVEAAADALAAGADGFLPKAAEPDAIITPLMAVLAGWAVVPHGLLEHLLTRARPQDKATLADFTESELVLWRLIAQGLDTGKIASQLFVSDRTAKRLVAALLRRLGVTTRIEAAAAAGRAGLLDD
jgi:DNA-binding NarL/FixJ family response regulator